MRNLLIAGTCALGLALSGNASAGGIQIQPDGGGGIAGSVFLPDIGGLSSSFGNFLAENMNAGAGINTGPPGGPPTTLHGQNILGSAGGGQLTMIWRVDVVTSINVAGDKVSWAQAGSGTFDLFFDTAPETNVALMTSGLGYGLADAGGAHHIASGAVTIFSAANFGNDCLAGGGTTCAPMSSNNPIPSVIGTGTVRLDVDFDGSVGGFVDSAYIVNDLNNSGVGSDIKAVNSLSLELTRVRRTCRPRSSVTARCWHSTRAPTTSTAAVRSSSATSRRR